LHAPVEAEESVGSGAIALSINEATDVEGCAAIHEPRQALAVPGRRHHAGNVGAVPIVVAGGCQAVGRNPAVISNAGDAGGLEVGVCAVHARVCGGGGNAAREERIGEGKIPTAAAALPQQQI
jgi:hypothetical protein